MPQSSGKKLDVKKRPAVKFGHGPSLQDTQQKYSPRRTLLVRQTKQASSMSNPFADPIEDASPESAIRATANIENAGRKVLLPQMFAGAGLAIIGSAVFAIEEMERNGNETVTSDELLLAVLTENSDHVSVVTQSLKNTDFNLVAARELLHQKSIWQKATANNVTNVKPNLNVFLKWMHFKPHSIACTLVVVACELRILRREAVFPYRVWCCFIC